MKNDQAVGLAVLLSITLLPWETAGGETPVVLSAAQQKKQTRPIGAAAPPGTAATGQSSRSSFVLCQVVACGTPAPPTITSINKLPVNPSQPVTITPGGKVVLNGTNFSDKNGKFGTLVLLMGDPRALLHREFPLQDLQWSDEAAIGTIPLITGFTDQPAQLQLRRSDGMWSVPLLVQFYADRDVTVLSASSVAQSGIICSRNADQNQCNSWSDFGATGPPPDLAFLYKNMTVYAVHNSFLGTETGSDQYRIVLKNGWVYRERQGPVVGPSSCEWPGHSVLSSTLAETSRSDFTITVQWTSTCQFDYGMWLMMEGPKGIPPN